MFRVAAKSTPVWTDARGDQSSKAMYFFLVALTAAAAVSFQGWRTLLNNFAVETAGLNGSHMGFIQAVREVPGFLSLLVVYLLLVIREHRLAAASVAVLGLGVTLTGLSPTFAGIAIATVIMSFGFHYYETVNQSLSLQYFDFTQAPLVIARLRSIMAAGNIVVGGAIYFMAMYLDYRAMFAIVGLASVGIGLFCLTRDPTKKDIPLQHKKMIFKRRYWLYYVLTFMAGARRQIFVAFAIFLLVERLGYTVKGVTILFIINNVINYFVNPLIGRAVNRFGERRVLSLEYLVLIGVFLAYAVTDNVYIAASLYVIDNIFFNFAMAIRTFFQKISDPKDIAPSMALGFTINHIASVVVPVMGGLLWLVDYRIVFIGGAALSLVSLLLVQLIDGQLAKAGAATEAD